jgi:hypothetical protein
LRSLEEPEQGLWEAQQHRVAAARFLPMAES